jgi:hypothetical protein
MKLRGWTPACGEHRTESRRFTSSSDRAAPVVRLARRLDAAAVAQLQASAGNRAVSTILQREPKGPPKQPEKKPVTPKAPAGSTLRAGEVATGPHQLVYLVRDKGFQLGGGVLVEDLADFKKRVMATKNKTDWTLVLGIHGSENRLGAQAPPNWEENAKFYDESVIGKRFGDDKAFVQWRDQYGPIRLVLVGCAVGVSLEGAMIANLTRPSTGKSRQSAKGLGKGCKPIAESISLNDAPTRKQYNKLPDDKRNSIYDQLKKWNEEWGYYGAPPVPEDQLLTYYYDEAPKGAWVMVEVSVGEGHEAAKLKRTGIAFWNRTTGPKAAEFKKLCDQGVDELKRTHEPTVPSVPDEPGVRRRPREGGH